jgi:hypothetical protein
LPHAGLFEQVAQTPRVLSGLCIISFYILSARVSSV